MNHKIKSIRPFVGSKNFNLSCQFYRALGFEEISLSSGLTYFKSKNFGFYLQDAFVEDWVNNTMVFMEVEELDELYSNWNALQLPIKFIGVRIEPIKKLEWGREFFLHDPSGILWHVGEFY